MTAYEHSIEGIDRRGPDEPDGAAIAQLVDATRDYELLPAESAAGLGL